MPIRKRIGPAAGTVLPPCTGMKNSTFDRTTPDGPNYPIDMRYDAMQKRPIEPVRREIECAGTPAGDFTNFFEVRVRKTHTGHRHATHYGHQISLQLGRILERLVNSLCTFSPIGSAPIPPKPAVYGVSPFTAYLEYILESDFEGFLDLISHPRLVECLNFLDESSCEESGHCGTKGANQRLRLVTHAFFRRHQGAKYNDAGRSSDGYRCFRKENPLHQPPTQDWISSQYAAPFPEKKKPQASNYKNDCPGTPPRAIEMKPCKSDSSERDESCDDGVHLLKYSEQWRGL